MSNELDPEIVAITVADRVAMAQFDELEYWSFELAAMVKDGLFEKQWAVDTLYVAALAGGLVHRHGPDHVTEIIAFGFEGASCEQLRAVETAAA
jgi:hypothetical protein